MPSDCKLPASTHQFGISIVTLQTVSWQLRALVKYRRTLIMYNPAVYLAMQREARMARKHSMYTGK